MEIPKLNQIADAINRRLVPDIKPVDEPKNAVTPDEHLDNSGDGSNPLETPIDTSIEPTPEPRKKLSLNTGISRRDFLIAGGILGGAIAIKAFLPGGVKIPEIKIPNINLGSETMSTATPEAQVRSGLLKIELDTNGQIANERVIKLSKHGVSWTPDTITPKYEVNGKREYIISGNASCYRLETSPGISFTDAVEKLNASEQIPLCWGPDDNAFYNNPRRGEVHFRNGYSAITSVLQTKSDNPNFMFGITHNEEWAKPGDGGGFTASVGLVKSEDGGKTWSDLGPILTGNDPREPIIGQDCSGVGEPSAIIIDNDVYIYHIDWTKTKRELYLVKKELLNNGTDLGPNQYYIGNGEFTTEYNPDKLVPAIPVPDEENSDYSANPHVSWNNYLGQYLVIFTSNVGLHQATSQDGITFSKSELIYKFDHLKESNHSNWLSYFTFESPNTNSSQITDKSGILMYGRRQGGGAHIPVFIPVEIA